MFVQHCYGHCHAIHLQRVWEEDRNLWNLSWALKTINGWDLNLYQHNFLNEKNICKKSCMLRRRWKYVYLLDNLKKGQVLIEKVKRCSIWKEVFDHSFYSQIFQRYKKTDNLWQEAVISYFHGVHLLTTCFLVMLRMTEVILICSSQNHGKVPKVRFKV